MSFLSGPPTIEYFKSSPEILEDGQEGSISCRVIALPKAKVSLYKKSGSEWKLIDNPSRESKGNSASAAFKLTKVNIDKDFGDYKCIAENELKNQTSDVLSVKVTKAGKGKFEHLKFLWI